MVTTATVPSLAPTLNEGTTTQHAILLALQEQNRILKMFHRDMMIVGGVYLLGVAITFCAALFGVR